MNREIKFKLINKKTNEVEIIELTSVITSSGSRITGFFLINDFPDDYKWLEYIGRKDKKGTEIYDQDIVEWDGVNGGIPGGKIGGKDIINYDNKEACFKFGNLSFVEDANRFNDNFPDYDEIEVVDNIYENPELLDKNN